jgi:hypothetical protein
MPHPGGWEGASLYAEGVAAACAAACVFVFDCRTGDWPFVFGGAAVTVGPGAAV